MTKDLYVQSVYTPSGKAMEKRATHRLSTSFQNWPIEIIKVLGEDYGWVTESVRPATVDIEKVDKENGTGYGAVVVFSAPPRESKTRAPMGKVNGPQGPAILLPFIVRNYQMSPLDVFISGKKVLPLTRKRLQEEMMTASTFGQTDRSRQNSNTPLTQLSPPADMASYSRFGNTSSPEGGMTAMGAAGAVKTGGVPRLSVLLPEFAREIEESLEKQATLTSTQDSMILQQLVSTVSERERRSFSDSVQSNPAALVQFVRNKNVDVLQRLMKGKGLVADDFKNTTRWGFSKNVLLFEKVSAGRWRVTMYNDFFLNPEVVTLTERELLTQFSGVGDINEKLWKTNGFVATVDHKEIDPVLWSGSATPETAAISSTGPHLVVMKNHMIEEGFAWKGFQDYDGNRMDYVLWYDGDCWGVQEQVQGEKLSKEWPFEDGFLKPGTWGTFLVGKEDGERHPVMPFKVIAVYTDRNDYPGTTMIRATDMFGHDVNFLVSRGVDKWRSATGIIDPTLAGELGGRAYWVPLEDVTYITLGSQKVEMCEIRREVENGFRDTAVAGVAGLRDLSRPASAVAVTCMDDDGSRFLLEGKVLEPLTRMSGYHESRLKSKWALVMLGCSLEDAEKILDRACTDHRVFVMNLRPFRGETNVRIDKATDEVIKISAMMRRDLLKEAAYIRDRKSVDALLSLNFVNPDNLIVFLKNLPQFREVEASLAKLLLMARFGLEAVPESAIENALKNLTVVNEALELLRGVLGNEMSAHGDVEFEDTAVAPNAGTMLEE